MSENPYAPPTARVGDVRPPAELDYDLAGFWMRFAAFAIDTLLLMFIIMPLMLAVYGRGVSERQGFTVLGPVDILLNYVLPFVATIFFWRYKSATPGKLILSLRVVDARTLGPMSWGQIVGRYFAYVVSTLPLFFGFLWIAWDARKQAWHDKMAGTLVIRVHK
jgi:uncharacterized RDD family membrane protein YckC